MWNTIQKLINNDSRINCVSPTRNCKPAFPRGVFDRYAVGGTPKALGKDFGSGWQRGGPALWESGEARGEGTAAES